MKKNIINKYDENSKNEINQFQNNYTKEKSIQLYYENIFIHNMLNKALKMQDIELIYLFRDFILDLYDQIQ